MENLPKIDMTEISIVLFEFIGNFAAMSLTLAYMFANLFHAKGDMYVKTMQSIIYVTHLILKYTILIITKPTIEKIFKDIINHFWNCRHFDRETVQTVNRIYRVVKRIEKGMVTVSMVLMHIYYLKPVYNANNVYLMETLTPESPLIAGVLLMCQYYCFCFGMNIVLGIDFIYLALCVHMVLQLKLLKRRLRDILRKQSSVSKSAISNCIKHHQFLFALFFRMKSMYSTMLLFHYFATLISTCGILFDVVVRHTSTTSFIEGPLSVLFFIGQFAYYTFPAEQVALEFSDVSDAIYISEWYKNDVHLPKTLLPMMIMGQKMHYLSAAGFIDINIDTFGSVIRKSFSFCMVLKDLFNK